MGMKLKGKNAWRLAAFGAAGLLVARLLRLGRDSTASGTQQSDANTLLGNQPPGQRQGQQAQAQPRQPPGR